MWISTAQADGLLYRHAVLLFQSWHFLAGVGLPGHFDVLKRRFWHDGRRTLNAFSSAWQAWYFLHVARTSAGLGHHERWFGRSFSIPWQAQYSVNVHNVLKHFKVSFRDAVVIVDPMVRVCGDFARQVRYFGCLRVILGGSVQYRHPEKLQRSFSKF